MSSDTDSAESTADSGSSVGSSRHSYTRPPRQEQWPPSFCCPITQEPMVDPVVAMDGHSYESAVISEWLREHHTSPVNGDRLTSKVLVRNVALRNAMAEWDELLGSQTSGASAAAGMVACNTSSSGIATPIPEPEPEPEEALPSQDSTSSRLQSATSRGPIVFEPQSDWDDLVAARRQRSVRAGGNPSHHWLNRVCMLLMMAALGVACYTMYVYDPWDQFSDTQPGHAPQQPIGSKCHECHAHGCCLPCPSPWEKYWYPPGEQSLERQLFKWDKWNPTRLEDHVLGDARFTGCEFKNPLPSRVNKTNSTRHSYARVNWIETRSAIQACDTEEKSSCVE